nr:MAG TPA: hypothetical protein [Caudoviricetes sp.]
MKTQEQIKEYIKSQEWFKRLGINLDDIKDFPSLLATFMVASFQQAADYDWKKINEGFQKWLAE